MMPAKRIEELWTASNEGAKLLSKECYQEAFLRFHSATDNEPKFLFQAINDDISYDAFSGIQVIPLSARTLLPVDEVDCLRHDVFVSPFVIYSQRGLTIEDSNACLVAGTAVILLNMAIACHRQFFIATCPATRRQLLSEARDFYQSIHVMLADLPLDPDDPITQLYMVSCTNLAHVFTELGDLEKAQYWKNELAEAFACVSLEHPGGTFRFVQRVLDYFSVLIIAAAAA